MIDPKYTNQKDYTINNKQINLSSDVQLSRHYLAEAEFLIKEVLFF